MTATNTAILDELEGAEQSTAAKHAAERDKALATYWSILADPARTSAADKAAMAAAMKTLGKSIAQADADAKVIEVLRTKPEIDARAKDAASALLAAEIAHRDALEKRPAELLKVHQVVKDKWQVIQDRTRERDGASGAVRDAREFLAAHANAAEEARRFVKL